jgi:RHS repeat-associated protein
LTYPNNQSSTYTYHPNAGDRRLQEIHHRNPAGATLSRFAYTYDAVGNISTWTQQYDATTRAYALAYDAADQLTSAIYRTTDPTPTILKRYGYTYDAVGNRTNDQIDDTPRKWTHDGMNRITAQAGGGPLTFAGTVSEPSTVTVQSRPATVSGSNTFSGTAVVSPGISTVQVAGTDASGNSAVANYEVDVAAASDTFAYDGNGNLTQQGTRTYEWDAANRLVRVLEGPTVLASFAYDGFGRRVRTTAGGVLREYVYADSSTIEERVGTEVSRYVQGRQIDQILATVSAAGIVTYSVADHLGSVVQTTSGAGAVLLTRQYDPFGGLLAGVETNGPAFTGRDWDAEIGLYFFRARYYTAATGRFLTIDPLGYVDGPNAYAYVANRPTVATDPFGLQLRIPVPQDIGAMKDFIDNYREMRRRNTIGADPYFHCMANCQASNRGPIGAAVASVISEGREIYDQYVPWKRDTLEQCNADRAANRQGRRNSQNQNQSCEQRCGSLRPKGL